MLVYCEGDIVCKNAATFYLTTHSKDAIDLNNLVREVSLPLKIFIPDTRDMHGIICGIHVS